MVIIYESKTGFTKRYADMLAAKLRLTAFRVQEISNINLKDARKKMKIS